MIGYELSKILYAFLNFLTFKIKHAKEHTVEPAEPVDEPETQTATIPKNNPKPDYEDEPEAETNDSKDPAEEGKTSDNGQKAKESEDTDSGEFETQTVKTTLTVGEKAHNMCELSQIDQNQYRSGSTQFYIDIRSVTKC